MKKSQELPPLIEEEHVVSIFIPAFKEGKMIECLDLYSDRMNLSTVFLTEAANRGFRITEFPISYRPRNGHSKSKLNRLKAGWEILRILLLEQA
jgi:hypothetical protein